MEQLTEKEVYQYCIDKLKNESGFPFICRFIDTLFWCERITEPFAYKLKKKIQNRDNIPNELKNDNYVEGSALWTINEREMRIKYLENLISKL